MGNYAFSECSSLTSITIPNSVTNIAGSAAFNGCTFVKTSFINNSSLDAEAKKYWGAKLVDIEIDGLLIRNDTIVDCRPNVISVAIPNSVTNIGDQAFEACSKLTTITISNSVTSIGKSAFYNCSGLTSVTIGNNVTSIGKSAFESCFKLKRTNYTGDIAGWCRITFKNFYSNPIYFSNNLYINDQEIKDIIIPNTVDTIHTNAFYNCKSINSVTISNGVTSIGDYAFYLCSSLTSVTIPNSVTSIEYGAFSGCSSLDTVTCLAMTPPELDGSLVFSIKSTLFVPCEALSDYQSHKQWGQFTNIECISSEEVEAEKVLVESGSTDVTITWPTENNADTYTIVIKKDGNVVCTLTFNSDGQLLNIAFAPSRDGNNHGAQYAEQANNGYRFTVTALEEGTDYTYTITSKDADNNTLSEHSGEFTTKSATALDNTHTQSPMTNCQKLIRDGQLLIIRDGVEYNALGMRL